MNGLPCMRSRSGFRGFSCALGLLCALAFPALAGLGVKIEGNSQLRERAIREVLSPEPENYNKDGILTWQEDAQFYTLDLYRRNGYFDATVDVDVRPRRAAVPKDANAENAAPKEGAGEDWDAVLTIKEGERYLYDSVRVILVGDTGMVAKDSTAEAAAAAEAGAAPAAAVAVAVEPDDLKARQGKPYKEDAIFEDRRFLLQRYGNSGYVRAKVDDKVSVKPETRTVKVDYLVQASYPVLFDTLIIRNERAAPAESLEGITREELLRSMVKYRKGDTVRISGTDRLIEKLQYTGAYNFARLRDSLMDGPEHSSALILQLEERVPGNFRTSTFYETYSGFGVSADLRHSNVAGTLNELRGGGALASLRQTVYAGYGSPLTFGYLIRFDNDLGFSWNQDQEIHHPGTDQAEPLFGGDFRAINSTRLTWPWSYWLRLAGTAEVESKSRMLGPESRERSLNLNFIQTAYMAWLNQSLDPTRGIRVAPSWGNGGPLIEDQKFRFTEFRHNWLEIQSGYYYPLLPQFKLAMRLDGGRFFGEGGTNSDRFFLGGGRSVRSYGFRELCPETERVANSKGSTDSTDVCSTTGQTLAYALSSFELRMAPFAFGLPRTKGVLKHLRTLEFVPFYDIGKVWDVNNGFSLSGSDAERQSNGQGVAWGLGLRYPLLGIFNFRIDFAYGKPNKKGMRPDGFIVDLAQAF
jgi:outer membrane protein assembly factor BamA